MAGSQSSATLGTIKGGIEMKFEKANAEMVGGKPFEPMPGRIMKEYVLVPKEMIRSRGLKAWIGRSLSYASALPPKQEKAKKKK